jgi:predicted transposase/invertase (TIGR01784 family)
MGLLPMEADILPPSDDRVFKLILTSPEAKPVLMDLISAIIKRPVTDVVVRNNELPVEDTREKAERLDVNCTIDDGSQIDLEMQASRTQEISDGKHRNLKGKSIYYLCDLHSSQPAKGVKRYDMLARTYQVTFCSYTVFPNRKEYANSFSMRHDDDNELLSDALHVIFVEMSKLEGTLEKSVSEMTDLEKWAVFFQYADVPAQRETVNKIIESKEALQMAGDLLMSVSQDERERAVFLSRKKFKTDLESDLATAEDRGRQEGLEKGREEVARNLLNEGLPVELVQRTTGLDIEAIKNLQKERRE